MQIATLSYQYDQGSNGRSDNRGRARQRQILASVPSQPKKTKQRRSLFSDLSGHSNVPLPPIKTNGKRPNSIRIKGSSFASSKPLDTSVYSYSHQSRSLSRQSNNSRRSIARSRSMSPVGSIRPASKLNRLKFGHPVQLRSADFYGPDKTPSELRQREEYFVNDSIRSAYQSRRQSIIPPYEALSDPHLRQFFQSPAVVDIVRKTLNVDPNSSFKQDDRSSKLSRSKPQSKSFDPNDTLDAEFHRIVTKGSSGYGRLNGYDCIPSYAPARTIRRRSRTVDPTELRAPNWNPDSQIHRATTQDKYQTSANTSIASVPTNASNRLQQPRKSPSKREKMNRPQPIATSSPLRHPSRHTIEPIASSTNKEQSSTKSDVYVPEHKSEFTLPSNESQEEQ